MRAILLGGPGSGKGTQAARLSKTLNIPWISSGDMFRAAIAQHTPLGKQAQEYMERGDLVPDPVAIALIKERLLQPDAARGWLLDGYPRTAFQAEELHFLLGELNQHLNGAILLEVPDAVLMERCLQRATELPAGTRTDDRPEIVQRRIELFHDRTLPMLDYYQYRNLLVKIDANQPIEQVHQEILQKLQA